MPVVSLELENFKSYGGIQKIGPFSNFTCIIGPNGAGKSNLMDAISFVLGVHARDLRSHQLKDLIFRSPTAASNARLSASATLWLEPEVNQDEEALATQPPALMQFTRKISAAGVGEYLVNRQTVTRAGYEKALADQGVLVQARNFLVFQGDVEQLARKSPSELVQLVETVAGSAALAIDYEAAAAAQAEADQAALHQLQKQKGWKTERRLWKEQKEEAERFRELQRSRASLQTEFYLWQLHQIQQAVTERSDQLKEVQEELAQQEGIESEAGVALQAAKKESSAARRKTASVDREVRLPYATRFQELEPQVVPAATAVQSWKKKVEKDEKALEKQKTAAAKHDERVAGLHEELESYRNTLADLEKEYQEQTKGQQIVLTAEQEEEYQILKESAAAAAAQARSVLKRFQQKLSSSRAKADQITEQQQEAQDQVEQLKQSVQDMQEKKTTIQAVSRTKS
jgi:structural maintenance of chromosome 1